MKSSMVRAGTGRLDHDAHIDLLQIQASSTMIALGLLEFANVLHHGAAFRLQHWVRPISCSLLKALILQGGSDLSHQVAPYALPSQALG